MNTFAREEGLQFSPDSKILALWKEGSMAFWDVMGGKQLDKPIPVPGFGEAAFSPDSKLLLVKGYDKRIYDKLLVLDLQGIRWQKKIDWNPQFLINTPDSSFLVARNKSTGALATHEYEVIDLLTGATRTTIKVRVSSTAKLFGNGKYLAVFEQNVQEPNLLAQPLGKWWAQNPSLKDQVKVVDLASGKSLAAVPANNFMDVNFRRFMPQYLVSDDGRTLIVANPLEESWLVQCWTIPPHPPWTWVVGPPLGILLLAFAFRWLKRQKSTQGIIPQVDVSTDS